MSNTVRFTDQQQFDETITVTINTYINNTFINSNTSDYKKTNPRNVSLKVHYDGSKIDPEKFCWISLRDPNKPVTDYKYRYDWINGKYQMMETNVQIATTQATKPINISVENYIGGRPVWGFFRESLLVLPTPGKEGAYEIDVRYTTNFKKDILIILSIILVVFVAVLASVVQQ